MPNQAEKITNAIETRPSIEESVVNGEENVKIGDLKKNLADIDNFNNTIESNSIIGENRIEELRVDLIKDLLGKMKELGVDPGDNDSISNFLKNLEMQDPDLKELFESAFDGLLGQEVTAAPEAPLAPGGPGQAPTALGAGLPGLPGTPGPVSLPPVPAGPTPSAPALEPQVGPII